MAIYHLSASICSGAKGSSVMAAAAYQSGERLYSGLDCSIKDYKRKERVVHTEIFLPLYAPERYKDRNTLWSSVEQVEGMKGQYARRFVIALPRELSLRQNTAAVRAMAKKLTDRGMIVDAAIHMDDHNNPHVHLLCTTRPLLLNGEWGKKDVSIVVKEKGKDGKLHPVPAGRDKHGRLRYKRIRKKAKDWDRKETLLAIRKEWQDVCNAALERAGSDARIDCRSYRDRAAEDGGPELMVTKHLGPEAYAMEARGQQTEIGSYNRAVRQYNVQLLADDPAKELEQIENEKAEATRQLQDISDARMQITAQQSLIDSLTAEQRDTREKRLQLHDRCFSEDGDLYSYNRPSGIFATLSGATARFDRERAMALASIDKLDAMENSLSAKLDRADKDLKNLKRNLEWLNPTVTPAKTQTVAKGKTQQRTAAPTPRTGRKQGKGKASGAGLTVQTGKDDDKGMRDNWNLLSEAAKEEERNKQFWRGI